MPNIRTMLTAAFPFVLLLQGPTQAAVPDAQVRLAAQREAIAKFSMLDGTWRGPATAFLPNGEKRHMVQTERVGPMLDGSIRVIEGRGHDADGRIDFNAFAIISFTPQDQRYHFRSYAYGHQNDFVIEPRADGFAWTVQAGPAAKIRYTATIRDGTWTEIGERIVDGQPAVRTFEMQLKRIGDTTWPAGDAIGPR